MRALIVDGDASALQHLVRALQGGAFVVDAVTNRVDCMTLLRRGDYHLMIACERTEDGSGLDLLESVAHKWPRMLRVLAAEPSRLEQLGPQLARLGLFHTVRYPLEIRSLETVLTIAAAMSELPAATTGVEHIVLESDDRPPAAPAADPYGEEHGPRGATVLELGCGRTAVRRAARAVLAAGAARRRRPAPPGRTRALAALALAAGLAALIVMAVLEPGAERPPAAPAGDAPTAAAASAVPQPAGVHASPAEAAVARLEAALTRADWSAVRAALEELRRIAPDHPRRQLFEVLARRLSEPLLVEASPPEAAPAATPAAGGAPPASRPDPPSAAAAAAPPTGPRPDSHGAPVVAESRLLRSSSPDYPPRALRERVEGHVDLLLTIGHDGEVIRVLQAEGTPPGIFEDAAIAAVKRWRYEPRREDGVPVLDRARVRLEFRIDP